MHAVLSKPVASQALFKHEQVQKDTIRDYDKYVADPTVKSLCGMYAASGAARWSEVHGGGRGRASNVASRSIWSRRAN
jgi:hypothetical protein